MLGSLKLVNKCLLARSLSLSVSLSLSPLPPPYICFTVSFTSHLGKRQKNDFNVFVIFSKGFSSPAFLQFQQERARFVC